MSRIDAIQKIIASQPNDPFPRYGLAMELKNTKQHDAALGAFAELEQRFPDYVPQYLMHFNLLVELKKKSEAQALGERGLAAARKKGDAHAAGELQQAIDGLEYVED